MFLIPELGSSKIDLKHMDSNGAGEEQSPQVLGAAETRSRGAEVLQQLLVLTPWVGESFALVELG